MPNKGVDNVSFWKERLELAKKQNHLHYSVYLAEDGLWNRIYKAHLKIFEKEIKPTDRVIDLGCGYGRMAPLFEDYTGVDFSPDFIAEAKSLYPDKTFLEADLAKLPFDDDEFDVGFMVSIKNMIIGNLGKEAWEPIQKECTRVCKKLLILEYGQHESREDTEETIGAYEVL